MTKTPKTEPIDDFYLEDNSDTLDSLLSVLQGEPGESGIDEVGWYWCKLRTPGFEKPPLPYIDIVRWCKSTFEEGTWVAKSGKQFTISFLNESDFTMFKMTWSEYL